MSLPPRFLRAFLIFVVLTVANMHPQTPANVDMNTSTVDRAEVASLNLEIVALKRSTNHANTAKLWLALATGIGAILSWLAQHRQADFATQIAEKETRRSTANDRILFSELKDKDVRIGHITERAGQLTKDAEQLRDKASKAELEIAKSNERAANAEMQTAELYAEFSLLVMPRRIPDESKKRMVESLRAFSGTPYTLEVYNDTESHTFAEIIASLLRDAGWTRKSLIPKGSVPIPMAGREIAGEFTPFQAVDGLHLAAGKGQHAVTLRVSETFEQEGLSLGMQNFASGGFENLPVQQQGPMRIVVGKKMDAFDFATGKWKEQARKAREKIRTN